MAPTPEFGFQELFTHMVGEIARAMCERTGETAQQHFARSQAAIHMILGLLPRDVIEILLSGHCVMLHELMLASMRDSLLGETDAMRRNARSTIIALSKQFNSTLAHLARYQARPVASKRGEPVPKPTEARQAGTGPTGAAAQTHKGQKSPSAEPTDNPGDAAPAARFGATGRDERDAMASQVPGATIVHHPASALVAECCANPEAMAALEAGDPERFAKAMGIANPSEAFLEAANRAGSPFDPNASGPWPTSAASGRQQN